MISFRVILKPDENVELDVGWNKVTLEGRAVDGDIGGGVDVCYVHGALEVKEPAKFMNYIVESLPHWSTIEDALAAELDDRSGEVYYFIQATLDPVKAAKFVEHVVSEDSSDPVVL